MTVPTPPTRHSASFWIVTALNAVGVVTLLLVVTGRVFDLHGALFEAGGPLGLIALFFLIPLGWLTVWWLHRRQKQTTPAPHRYLLGSNLFLGAMWVLSCFVVGLYVFMYTAFIPRPLAASGQGPDTAAAQAGFVEHFGMEPQGTVRNLYYLHSPDLVLFRFDLEDGVSWQEVVADFQMTPQPGPCPLNLADAPEWWTARETPNLGDCYTSTLPGKVDTAMRVHADARRVFFKDFQP